MTAQRTSVMIRSAFCDLVRLPCTDAQYGLATLPRACGGFGLVEPLHVLVPAFLAGHLLCLPTVMYPALSAGLREALQCLATQYNVFCNPLEQLLAAGSLSPDSLTGEWTAQSSGFWLSCISMGCRLHRTVTSVETLRPSFLS